VRPVSNWAATAAPASATIPLPETITLLELKRWAASCGPREKKRPPIDHDESTARAASKNGRRATAGTLGRSALRRKRPRFSTGSGIQ
jgi:hypothetical protein